MHKLPVLLCAVVILAGISSCSKSEDAAEKETVIVVPISQHPMTFNPVTAKNETAKEISRLVYPGLYYEEFNLQKNVVEYKPQLASWSEPFGIYVMMRIKTDARWSDDIPVSAKDIVYTYSLYANEQMNTIWRPMLKGLKTDEAGNIDIAKAIEVDDDSTVTFHFVDEASVNYAIFTVPILPKHQMDALPMVQLKASIPVKAPSLAGPFLVAGLSDKEIVLKSNELSVIPGPAKTEKIAFHVFPGKQAQIAGMMAMQLDVAFDLTAADVEQIADVRDDIDVIAFPPMRYHMIGWNTIDPQLYRSSNGEKLKANRMFGVPEIRRAVTLAINRSEIVTEVIGKDAVLSFGPVSPMFKTEYHDTLHQLHFDPNEAKAILRKESWQDLTRAGTIEKFNKPFAFDLKVSSDNDRGLKIAEMVKKQLKDVAIDVTVVPVDPKLFPAMLAQKDFDAFIGSVDVPSDLSELHQFWSMSLTEAAHNYVSFRMKRVDEILDSASLGIPPADRVRLWKEFQDILQVQQPYAFLFWESRYAVKTKRVNGMIITPRGFLTRPWEWSVKE